MDNLKSSNSEAHAMMESLISDNNLDRLEAGVRDGRATLDSLERHLANAGDSNKVHEMIEDLHRVREQARQPRLIIGVVGDTGAGKSNLINALLDEEQLVPTSCMQACTAVVVEISYNYTNSPFNYQADIEFISLQDWEKELIILRAEMLDHNRQINKALFTDSSSDAAQAYLKIRAVYPTHSDEALAKAPIQTLMADAALKVLGTTRFVKATNVETFSKDMRKYVGSKAKSIKTLKANFKPSRQAKAAEHWPLIKVVRIFTKATALSTGAVLVDLPGVQDSNAARAAVAANYVQSCQAIWVAAPIQRAVDNKSAKILLGNAFKQQIKMDGMSGAITFVCTKTDEISVAEMRRDKNFDHFLKEKFGEKQRQNERNQLQLEHDITDLKEQKARPSLLTTSSTQASERRELSDLLERREQLREEEVKICNDIKSTCIQERNIWSRLAIQLDFADGIRRDDEEAAEAQDPELFQQGDMSLRDYHQIAQELPVFCVSSRAYSSVMGRIEKYDAVDGFSNPEQTAIPQLQDHCLKLAEDGRRQRCKEFLRGLEALLDSLRIWAAVSDGSQNSALALAQHKSHLMSRFKDLQKDLASQLESCVKGVDNTFRVELIDRFEKAIRRASKQAVETSDGWGKRQAEGGLHFNTYKATVRRDGVFHGIAGPKDFNDDLVGPMRMAIALAWERVFTERLPFLLIAFGDRTKIALQGFQTDINQVASRIGVSREALSQLSNIITTHSNLVADIVSTIIRKVQDDQKGVNREFKTRVQKMMCEAYSECAIQAGPGSFKAMKASMKKHVQSRRDQMFRYAGHHVQQQLGLIPKGLRSSIEAEFFRLTTRMERDVHAVLMQGSTNLVLLSDREKMDREKVRSVIALADEWIATMSDPNTQLPKADMSNTVVYHGTRTDDDHYIGIDQNMGEESEDDDLSADEEGDIKMTEASSKRSQKIKQEPDD